MRILAAEDEPDLLDAAVRHLKAEGLGADGCRDGEEALYFLESTRYDLAALAFRSGTGPGLSMVRWIAELHGGSTAVESEEGAGSRFTVLLPARPEEERI